MKILTSLAIREVWAKPTFRFQLIPVRMTIIGNQVTNSGKYMWKIEFE